MDEKQLKNSPVNRSFCEKPANEQIHLMVSDKQSKSAPKEHLQNVNSGVSMSKLIESRDFIKLFKDMEERIDYEQETSRQERIIRNLYDAINLTAGALFDREKEVELCGENLEIQNDPEPDDVKEGSTSQSAISPETDTHHFDTQQNYETTIQEISLVWTDVTSLIRSVKDHAVSYLNEKNKSIDKEQLTLESEIVQLAVDFAVNYSKLKSDFLLKDVRKHLGIKEQEKTELEHFMDSKTVATYTEEDLAAIAQTVRELNTSVLKEEDP